MRIAKIALNGFRCFKNRKKICFGPFSTIVGKNDTGKSSILHALDIFFNRALGFEDFNKDSDEDSTIAIEVSFTDLPGIIQLEETVDTDFVSENLLDADGFLTVKKVYSRKNLKKPGIYLIAQDYADDDFKNLCSLKEVELNSRGDKFNLDFKKSGAGITNKSKRQALREEANKKGITKDQVEFEVKESLLRALNYLPDYSLFPADYRLSEEETTFQREFKAVVETAVSKIPERDKIEKGVEEEIDKEVAKIHQFLLQHTDEVQSIKAKPSFKWKDLVSFHLECSDRQGQSIPFGKRGSGLRRLLMVAYFQYLAQRSRNEADSTRNIYGIEEPETFLHPGAQRTLLRSFQTITSPDQVLVTSHSPVFAGSTDVESLVLITRQNGVAEVHLGNSLDLLKVANELGVDPCDQIFGFKACVFVEGENDIYFLQKVSEILKQGNQVDKTLLEAGVGILDFGGADNLRHWITRSSLKKVNRKFAVLIDSDRKASGDPIPQRKINWKQRCESEGGFFFITRKREIENYLHREAIKRDRQKDKPFDDFTDMKTEFGPNVIKAVEAMTLDELLERDKYTENGIEKHELVEIVEAFLNLVV